MIDSGCRSDLFRRYGVSAPLRCALASPSSPFLVSTKNLSRGQAARSSFIALVSQLPFLAGGYPCFGQVTMNNPGLTSFARGGYAQSAFRFFQPTFQPGA
jgi:hypothetical protein